LGHRRHDCKEKETCSPAHYEKMLNLVKGYRALVKEGNGNFLLPSVNIIKNLIHKYLYINFNFIAYSSGKTLCPKKYSKQCWFFDSNRGDYFDG
jgi:hypothetical protein